MNYYIVYKSIFWRISEVPANQSRRFRFAIERGYY